MGSYRTQQTLRSLVLSFCCFLQIQSSAQFSYYDDDGLVSVEAGVGSAAYFGDLSQKATLLKNVGIAASLGVSYGANNHLRPVLTVSFLHVSADDRNNERHTLKARNLRFQSNILDVSLGLRYRLLSPNISLLSPYVYGGLGLFHFNPYTTDRTGTKRFLQTLGTEGQRLPGATKEPYKLTQFQLPFGVGLNLVVSRKINLALDAIFRKTFTDYLDDVSTNYVDRNLLERQNPILPTLTFRGDEVNTSATYPHVTEARGNPKNKDLYYTVGFKLIYKFAPTLEK